ncbi:MAG: aldose epimerase family protein, partial [Bacteroidota bacterium]
MKQVTISTPFITLVVLDYGAIIQKILVKDKKGQSLNVVVGSNYPNYYLEDTAFLGACVGRYAGRISKACFELDRDTYPLYGENGIHLHGGKQGFSKKYWIFEEVGYGTEPFITLSYYSKHLEEGYPGNLKVMLTYKLVDNQLHILHRAAADRSTIINLTNHSYFKLDRMESIDHYRLQLHCPQYLETNEKLLPTGEIFSVEDTEYDFLNERRIGETRLDTPYVKSPQSKKAARLYSRKSGISMDVHTDQPGMVVYTPPHFAGICFETQNFPDAPNQPHFP